ncbi:unnamed protein product, partial [Acanthocheilonema viteae]
MANIIGSFIDSMLNYMLCLIIHDVGMTATPHFIFAAMTKLQHHAAATATNLHPNSTTISSKEITMEDRNSGLCTEQSITELETSPLSTCRSASSSLLQHDNSVSFEKVVASNYHMITNHLSDTNNAYINNVKRRRKPD